MESSKGHSSRKRKHSCADNYQDNASTEDIFKPGSSHDRTTLDSLASSSCSTNIGSSYMTTNIYSSSEDSSTHSDSHLDECSSTNVNSSSEDSSSTHSDSHLDDCSTVYSQNVTASSSYLKNRGSYKPSCYSDLPEVVMHNIYRCLSTQDLINIRDVCDLWKHNTDKSSVWKHVPLSLNDSNIERLPLAPYIHTVEGNILNTELCVNVLVNNFQDLRRLNIYWYNYISAIQVSKVVRKFSNLECISLNLSAPDIIETLSVLQNCPKLKEIKFSGFIRNINWITFFNMLNNLKFLDTLDLTHLSPCVNSTELLYLLQLKMRRLVSLKVYLDNRTNEDILNNIPTIVTKIICDSDRLEKLVFSTSVYKLHADIILNFAEIKNLKSLELWLQSEIQPNVLARVTFPTSLEFIKMFFCSIRDTQKILQRIIESCPNFKYLNASYIEDKDINEQLEHINKLQNLHTIILEFCPHLSSQGLQHIGECSELRVLKLSKTSLGGSTYNSLKLCKHLQEIKLYKCGMRPKRLVATILDLERLTHLHLVQCYLRRKGKEVQLNI